MGKVFFCNSEPIDLNAIAIMGVSVKTGDNPIGYFGTGLKFSIATLLRSGHSVILYREGERVEFSVKTETIRGEQFNRVLMGDERLGFTTQLGRNWEPWQAYRELRCNCTDEGGVISDVRPEGVFGTVFEVDGEAISQCHRNRRKIFLESSPAFASESCAIHTGETHHAFYRGVRAHKHAQSAMLTYNILGHTELTEDRTIKHGYMVQYYAERALAECDDEDLVEQAIMAPRGTFEHSLDYSNAGRPSAAFMEVAFRLRHNSHCNRGAIKLWEKHAQAKVVYTEAALDAFDEQQITAALKLVARLGAEVDRRDFMVVEGLGASIFGAVRGSRILIAKAALDMGARFIASTIYEEWLHKKEAMQDESRQLQNLLFEKLFSMTERVCALEARS